MKLTIRNKENVETGKVDLPDQFSESVREDLIKRAFLAVRSNKRQRYGLKPGAGMRHSAKLSRRRRNYRGGYGHGISRVPRKILSRSGTRFNWVGANAPGTVGGKRAHGPTSDKIFAQKLNDKERRKAIRSAISASIDVSFVTSRGHRVPETFPFLLDDEFESFEKTKEYFSAFTKLGFADEMSRSSIKVVRAGKGTMRGRRYKKRVGPVIVVSSGSKALKTARNLAGFSVISVNDLNAEVLAPGSHAGRAALYTPKALIEMKEKRLFV